MESKSSAVECPVFFIVSFNNLNCLIISYINVNDVVANMY